MFLIAILHRDLRNGFFFIRSFLIWTFISLFYLDFYFPFSIRTFISFQDFYFFFQTFISFLDFYFPFRTNRDLILDFFQVFHPANACKMQGRLDSGLFRQKKNLPLDLNLNQISIICNRCFQRVLFDFYVTSQYIKICSNYNIRFCIENLQLERKRAKKLNFQGFEPGFQNNLQ